MIAKLAGGRGTLSPAAASCSCHACWSMAEFLVKFYHWMRGPGHANYCST